MKIIILQENLYKGLSVVGKIVGSKTNLPILENILISAEKKGLKLTATNLEIGINIWLPAKIEKTGQLTIPAKDLTEFISSLPATKVSLEKKQDKLLVKTRKYKAIFNTMSALEFPKVPSLTDKATATQVSKKIELETSKFIKAITNTFFAAAQDETKPVLTGVKVMCKGNSLEMVATDGYRLSLKNLKLKKKIDLPVLIIPARGLAELVRIIEAEKEGTLKLALTKDKNQLIFSFGSSEVITRLIEGEFPDFEKIIPEKGETSIVVDKQEFTQAIKAASIFARRSANIIKLKIEKDKLQIRANAPEIGENEVELSVKQKGKGMQIAFNFRFLQDFLTNFTEDSFVLELSSSLKPGLFKGEKDSSFLHVIMPVRLQEE